MSDPNLKLLVESEAELSVRRVSAWEHISQPFRVDVIACSREPVESKDWKPDKRGACIKLERLIGRGAALRVQQDDGFHKVWTGIRNHVEQVRFDETPGAESTYRLRVVPYLWLLSQRRNHRIFQHQKITQIVKVIFDEWHLKYELLLDEGHYPTKEYCTQYGETDLDFVHRLLEEAGIVYFFEVREVGGDKAQSFLVLADAAHSQPPMLELPYVDNPNEVHGSIFATNLRIAHQVRPGLVSLGDYNFRKPAAPLIAKSQAAPEPEGTRERYEFAPGQFLVETGGPSEGPSDEKHADDKSTTTHDADGEGKARAQRFLEAERHKKRYVMFESSAQNLTAGMIVKISGHPHDELQEKNLLVIESMDYLDASGNWGAVAEAVFTDVPYRAPRVTPRPRVAGVQSAIVVGPSGEEIYTDEFGRVRVRFQWDREGKFDDAATCWLRVANAWAGPQFGQMMIPRIGHEVIVDFLDGDPDQPVVVGRVYTQPSPVPYKLPDQKTRSTWQTNSTPSDKKSKNFNELMLEDKADQELVFVQAQRNYMTLVKHDETERTGKDRTDVVGQHRLGITSHVDSTHVGKQHLVQMVKVKDLKILKMEDPKTKPKDTFVEVVDKKITLTTGKSTIVLDGPSITVEAKGGIRMSADKNLVVKGTMVFVNDSASGADADADKKVDDEVHVPEDRRLNAILQLLAEKYDAKKRADEGEIAIKAQVQMEMNGYPSTLDPKLSRIVGIPVYVPDDAAKVRADHAVTRKAIQDGIGPIDVGDPDAAAFWANTANTPEELHATAEKAEKQLKSIVGESAGAVGGEANFGPGGAFAVKSKKSLARKIAGGTPVKKVSDGVRGTIIVDDPDQIPGAVQALQEAVAKNNGELVVDNKFAKPSDSGYGAVHADLLLRTAEGEEIRSEVQVHVRSLHDGTDNSIKEQSHKIYERTRDKDLKLGKDDKDRADQASMVLWQGGMAPHAG